MWRSRGWCIICRKNKGTSLCEGEISPKKKKKKNFLKKKKKRLWKKRLSDILEAYYRSIQTILRAFLLEI